jgi:hypothetical protein
MQHPNQQILDEMLVCLPHPVKDHLGLRTPGVYRSRECDRVYTGLMGHSIDIRLKEHQWHIQLEHPDKLAIARDTAFNSV